MGSGCSNASMRDSERKVRCDSYSANDQKIQLDLSENDDCISIQPTVTSNSSFRFDSFLSAIKNNQMTAFECENYLQNEPDAIFAYDCNGDTAIHFAANNRNLDLLRVLVKFKVSNEKPTIKRVRSVSADYPHDY